jgi:transcriptional regulator with XRE-family HTH domain
MNFDEAVGSAIRTRRKSRKVSMPELAKALNLSTSALSRIENGKTQTNIVHLRRIARRLDVPGSLVVEDAERLLKTSSQTRT